MIDGFGALWDGQLNRASFVVAANAEQRSLGFGEFAHFTQFILFVEHAASRLFIFSLSLALVLVALFLLTCLLFLTLGKSRSASWHTQSPEVLRFILWPGYNKGRE